jgi:signal peptidase II
MIDRIHQGYVTDFVSVGTFPVWNVADASISTGVVVLLAGLWIMDNKKKKIDPKTTSEPSGDVEKIPEKLE